MSSGGPKATPVRQPARPTAIRNREPSAPTRKPTTTPLISTPQPAQPSTSPSRPMSFTPPPPRPDGDASRTPVARAQATTAATAARTGAPQAPVTAASVSSATEQTTAAGNVTRSGSRCRARSTPARTTAAPPNQASATVAGRSPVKAGAAATAAAARSEVTATRRSVGRAVGSGSASRTVVAASHGPSNRPRPAPVRTSAPVTCRRSGVQRGAHGRDRGRLPGHQLDLGGGLPEEHLQPTDRGAARLLHPLRQQGGPSGVEDVEDGLPRPPREIGDGGLTGDRDGADHHRRAQRADAVQPLDVRSDTESVQHPQQVRGASGLPDDGVAHPGAQRRQRGRRSGRRPA